MTPPPVTTPTTASPHGSSARRMTTPPFQDARPADSGRPGDDDLTLIRAIRRGDSSAWTPLLSRHQNRVYAVCVRMVGDRELALDLAQDTLVKVIQGLDSYDGRSQLSTWITRIAINVCLSKLRSEKLRRHASLDAPSGGTDDPGRTFANSTAQTREQFAADRVQSGEDRRLVLTALMRIDPEQRAILVLRDSRGMDYERIAEVLGVAVGTVKSRLFRARTALRENIEALEKSGGSGDGRGPSAGVVPPASGRGRI